MGFQSSGMAEDPVVETENQTLVNQLQKLTIDNITYH